MPPRSPMPKGQENLLRAVVAQPDDDVVRLVYADWLDEHGQTDQADFIRAGCELARLPAGDARRVELEVRTGVLLRQHRDAWLGGLAKWVDRSYVTSHRGFPWSVSTTRKAFVRNASALAARTVIQEACLDAVAKDDLEDISGLPIAGRLRSIRTFSSSFAELRGLLAASTELTALALFNTCNDGDVGPRRLADLLALPSVRKVAHLTLRLRDEGEVARGAVEAVAAAELGNVQTLGLDVDGLRHETLGSLLHAPFLGGLKTLSLTGKLDARALEMFGATASLAGLRSLRLLLDKRGGPAFAELAGEPALGGLTELAIAGPEAECVAALGSGLTGRLRMLELRSWSHTRAKRVPVVRRLAESGRLAGLIRLCVADDDLTDADVSALASGPHLSSLIHLDLGETEVTADALEALAGSPHLPALRAVTAPAHLVGYSRSDAESLRALSARAAGRFAVLAPPPGWSSCSPGDLRLGVY